MQMPISTCRWYGCLQDLFPRTKEGFRMAHMALTWTWLTLRHASLLWAFQLRAKTVCWCTLQPCEDEAVLQHVCSLSSSKHSRSDEASAPVPVVNTSAAVICRCSLGRAGLLAGHFGAPLHHELAYMRGAGTTCACCSALIQSTV